MSSRIDAVIFDNAGVLFANLDGIGKRYTWQMPRAPDKLESEFKGDEFYDLIHGKISETEFFKRLRQDKGWVGDMDVLTNLVREHLKQIPGTIDIVKDLHEKGIKLGLLSGHAKEWIEFLQEQYRFHHNFDKILYSYMAGYGKENLEFFKDIAQLLEVQPNNCLIIDDREKYLETAEKIGMQTILFTNADELRDKLINLGLLASL